MYHARHPRRPSVKYGNEFLYSSFDATGYHFNNEVAIDSGCALRNIPWTDCSGNLVRQIHRIQSATYGFTVSKKDVNQFGKMARVDSVAIDTPTVTMDFEYFLADGFNEQVMGFIVDGEHQALYNHIAMNNRVGCNIFVATMPEGHEVVGANLKNTSQVKQIRSSYEGAKDTARVVGIGNAFLNQYAVTVEVGNIPKARMSFDAYNMRSYEGFCDLPIPAINPKAACIKDNVHFSLPDTYESFVYEQLAGQDEIVYQDGAGALKPGNIRLTLGDAAIMSQLGSDLASFHRGAAHIQGFTINVPLGNTRLNRIGSYYEFARSIDFPSLIEVEVQAIISELKDDSSVKELFYCPTERHDLVLLLEDCQGIQECDYRLLPVSTNMAFYIKGAMIQEESITSNITDNKVVSLKFTAPLGGLDDKGNGLFIFGKSYFPDKPKILAWGQPL
jgi:hypothetical protein